MADPRDAPADEGEATTEGDDGAATAADADAGADPGSDAGAGAEVHSRTDIGGEAGANADDRTTDAEERTTEELRARVEEKYDFENFGPEDMAEMTAAEWEAAFDAETWITGESLLDRTEADLKQRVLDRDVFARVERLPADQHGPERLVAYSDEGYAVVYPDGTVEGRGTVLRDVKPTVALASMEAYDVPDVPDEELLPRPMEVPEGSGEFGNLMIQVVAAAQVLAGLALLGAGVFLALGGIRLIVIVAGLGFLAVGVLLFLLVANARLSDKFRAEEYRNRLRAVGVDADDRPDFLPPEAGGGETPAVDASTSGTEEGTPGEPRGEGSGK